ncbi:hypothetical protein RI129_003468 [Pyrocoelia pectoralis]|uniref:Luciferin 4-monooxygenase n=1 Tax=Pyrocoelia pectoralis TaxID=417401 RepID=A0AAN7ZUI0_9COLE
MDEEHIIYGDELKVPVPNVSVGIQLHNALKQNKDVPILIDTFTGDRISSKTLLNTASRLGNSLKNFGLTNQDIIGVCSENNLHFFDPVLAALFAGITLTTFSSQYTERELTYIANLSQPSVIFCSVETVSTVLKIEAQLKRVPKIIIINHEEDYKGCQCVKNFISENISKTFDVDAYEPVPVNIKDDVATILYSSGTTGFPKGVMITHLNISTVFAIYMDGRYGLQRSPCIAFVPFYHTYGLFLVLRKFIFVSYVLIMKKFVTHIYLQAIQDYNIEELQVVPSVAQLLAKTDLLNNYDMSSVKSISCAGAPLSKHIEELLQKRLKVDNVRQRYGMTETTVGFMGHKVNKRYPSGTCGDVFPSVSVKVVDLETGKALGSMKTGEICCRGNVVMKGYLNNSEATNEMIDIDGWLHTGDIGFYDSNKTFFVVDRIKDLIKCKGFQVAPVELEALLLNHSKIADAGVIGIPDERYGEIPLAFIVKVQGENLSEKEVENFVAGKVAPYKRLRGGVKFVPQIPRNPSGKILRRMLRNEVNKFKSNL